MKALTAAGSGLSTDTAVVVSLLSVVVLASLHVLAPHLRRLPFVPEYAMASFAGGIAVSYVFLHLLPELSEGNQELRAVLGEDGGTTPLLGLEVFLVALIGFVVFYGLERLAERLKPSDAAVRQQDTRSDASGRMRRFPRRGAAVFRVHLASYMFYNAIIAYTLPLNYRVSVWFAVLFTVAMGLHFVLSDRGLEEHYGTQFDRLPPRLVLAAALLLGWFAAAIFAPTGSLVVSLLTAFLAGSILLNVFKEEIPSTRRSHYGWFVTGLASYALLLVLVTALQESVAGETGAGP